MDGQTDTQNDYCKSPRVNYCLFCDPIPSILIFMRAGSRNSDMEKPMKRGYGSAPARGSDSTNRGNGTTKTGPPIQPPLVVQLSVKHG